MVFPFEYNKGREKPILFNRAGETRNGLSQNRTGRDRGGFCCEFRTQWIIWRVISAVMGLFFFAAAYVQYNDPDPYIWIIVYIIPCIVSWAVAFGLTIRKYGRVPSSPEPSTDTCSTDSSIMESPVKRRVGVTPKKPMKLEVDVMIPKYGSSNTKLNWLINAHVVYCFALGLWILVINFSRFYSTDGNHAKVNTTRVFSRSLQMDPGTEEAKELMGLCLVIAWLSLLRQNNYVLLGRLGIFIAAALTIIPFVAWICVEMFEGAESNCR